MEDSAPNPFQPIIDAAVSGFSKVAAALVLGAVVYVVVILAFRIAGRGGQFSDFIGRAAMGASALFVLYVGFVGIGPVKTGIAQSAAAETSSQSAATSETSAPADGMSSLISGILGEIDDRWSEIFQASGQAYLQPRIVLFRNATDGGRCGIVQAAEGAFYCAPDRRIFLPTAVFREIETRLEGCHGDACKAAAGYIVAREVGHHVQNLLGILPKVMQLQQQTGSKAEANALQVKVELQADCLSGVWFNREEKQRPGFIGVGHIDAAMAIASSDGRGQAGSAEQRRQWFTTGYQQGTLQACNTFAAGAL
ncbi:putative metalloprotease [Bradyrhizobium sp. WSM471]|nr:neutral zinc metallopeptidase [Bradyrhizobium sp. WSM471]EHR03023.1 putative metalloprotease [Bradyrhizobium sp. WSM471]